MQCFSATPRTTCRNRSRLKSSSLLFIVKRKMDIFTNFCKKKVEPHKTCFTTNNFKIFSQVFATSTYSKSRSINFNLIITVKGRSPIQQSITRCFVTSRLFPLRERNVLIRAVLWQNTLWIMQVFCLRYFLNS